MKPEHFKILIDKGSEDESGNFAIFKALRIFPTNKQVEEHNEKVLQYFRSKGTKTYVIHAQDKLVDATRNDKEVNVEAITSKDINKTGGIPHNLKIFVGGKVMLRSNIDVSKGLVNGAIGFITEIIWPCYRQGQIYDQDVPTVKVVFDDIGEHNIFPMTIQFSAKRGFGTIERRMLPLILSWAATAHKLQGTPITRAVVYLGPKLFADGQAYVMLSLSI